MCDTVEGMTISGLTNLKLLSLDDIKVTAEGVKKLQEALPNCEIDRYL